MSSFTSFNINDPLEKIPPARLEIDFPTMSWRQYKLPNWLFYIPKVQDAFVSPAASFKPASALDGQPWQSITTPSQQAQAKSLVVDTSIFFNGINEIDVLSLCEWFRMQGINVYLCTDDGAGNQFHAYNDDVDFEHVANLSTFNAKQDYERIATSHNLVRDKTAVLNPQLAQQLYTCLHLQQRHMIPLESVPQQANPICRAYDSSAYAVHIPNVQVYGDNIVKSGKVYYTKLSGKKISISAKPFLALLSSHSSHPRLLLEKNRHLIDKDITKQLYDIFPNLRSITMPFCYELCGLINSNDVDYYIHLTDCLNVRDLPLEQLHFSAKNLIKLKKAYPDLEQRFDELLNTANADDLLKVFPHRAHEIFSKKPIENIGQLSRYIKACPEDADSIIDKYFELIKSMANNLIGHDYHFKIMKHANTYKEKLCALLGDDYIEIYLMIFMSTEPSNAKVWLETIRAREYSQEVWASILNQYPNLIELYLEVGSESSHANFLIDKVNNIEVARRLYEHFKPKVDSIHKVFLLLSLYPEHYDSIIEEYDGVLYRDTEMGNVRSSMPVSIVLRLIEQYPERVRLPLDISNHPTTKSEWQHPKIIKFIEQQLLAQDAYISTWLTFYKQIPSRHQEFTELIATQGIKITGQNITSMDFFRHAFLKSNPVEYRYNSSEEDRGATISSEDMMRLVQTPVYADPNPNQPQVFDDCLKLSIGLLDDDLAIDFSQFPNLKQMVINSTTAKPEVVESFFKKVQRNCPKLCYLTVPEPLEQKTKHLPYQITYKKVPNLSVKLRTFIDFSASVGRALTHFGTLGSSMNPEKLEASMNALSQGQTVSRSLTTQPAAAVSLAPVPSPYLFVADNKLNQQVDGRSGKSTFKMQKTGKLLNAKGRAPHRLRTGVIELRSDFKHRNYKVPQLSHWSKPRAINSAVIEKCRNKQDAFYYHMQLKVKANQCVKLLSVDANEQLLALSTKGADFELFKGDDDFYYLKASKDCEVNYLIKTPPPEQTLITEIDGIPELNAIIDGFTKSPKFKQKSKEGQPKRDDESFEQWFERLYQNPGGSCTERCYAVWYQIRKNPDLKNKVRLQRIDNNHVRLELLSPLGRWQQLDLGGQAATLEYDNRSSFQAETAIDSQPPVAGVKQEKEVAKTKEEKLARFTRKLAKPKTRESLKRLRASVKQRKQPQVTKGFDEALSKKQSPVMLINNDCKRMAMNLLRACVKKGRPVFYLHSPSQVRVGKEQMHLESVTPMISTDDSLDLFLKAHGDNPDAIIMIDWNEFSPQKKVSLNSVLDKEQSLYGKPLAIKTFSLCTEMPEDSSFVSRHLALMRPLMALPEASPKNHMLQDYDLKGLPDWQETLFGEVSLDKNEVHWHKSELVNALEERNLGQVCFALQNLPTNQLEQVSSMIERSQAQGYFEYHHAKIPIPEGVSFTVNKQGFDFKKFKPTNCARDVELDQAPEGVQLINTTVFDFLLTNKSISNGVYHKLPGWLQRAKNNKIDLLISSDLSDSQWYCLLQEASAHHVTLNLYMAPGVTIPHDIRQNKLILSKAMDVDEAQIEPTVIVSNNPRQAVEAGEETFIFAIEDYSYKDLMKWITFHYENNQFTNFDEKVSDLFKALESGRKVVLYGEFSKPMLHALHQLLVEQFQGQYKGKLVLSIDDKNCSDLGFLPEYEIKVMNMKQNMEAGKSLYFEEVEDMGGDLQDSGQKAQEFIDKRLDALVDCMKNNAITLMEGKTGVGKTFLMRELADKYKDEFVVIHELENFDKLKIPSPRKKKVLFLDEVNIADKHMTMLSPLTEGGNPRILFNGEIYHFNKDEVRVVCAQNPQDYGGGRMAQKLFEQGGIAKMTLTELPNYYLYERMLKPIFDRVKPYMTEDDFKAKCEDFLMKYNQQQQNKSVDVCVRDLQEWVVTFAMQTVKDQPQKLFKRRKVELPIAETDIAITSSMKPLHKDLRRAIEVRKQRFLDDRKTIIGKNGVLIEGRPGMGKSELVRYRLNRSGYIRVNPGKDASNNALSYIKIDASLPDVTKKDCIRRAFNQGQIVWLDEVNSTLDDGFEQWMNAFLSGFDPETHEKAKKPGFMLLVTANSIGMEGRSLIGPAFRGRLTVLKMVEPNQQDLHQIISKHCQELDGGAKEQMAQDLHQLMREDKNLTLRELTPHLTEYATIYHQASHTARDMMPRGQG